jgi:hypothetical protein
VWCLYEILLTLLASKKLTVLSPPQEKAALSAALETDLRLRCTLPFTGDASRTRTTDDIDSMVRLASPSGAVAFLAIGMVFAGATIAIISAIFKHVSPKEVVEAPRHLLGAPTRFLEALLQLFIIHISTYSETRA